MRPLAASALLVVALLTGCGDSSPGGKAASARHENFEEIGEAYKGVTDELKKPAPDVAELREDVGKIHQLAPMVPSWFPAGSGPQDGVKTEALAAAWTDPTGFKQAADRFVAASDQLKGAAERTDLAAIRTASQALGGACKGCHDKYREKES